MQVSATTLMIIVIYVIIVAIMNIIIVMVMVMKMIIFSYDGIKTLAAPSTAATYNYQSNQ